MTSPIKIIKGELPILISAPHAYSHRRPHLEGKVKQGEYFTDDIAREISKEINCFSITTTTDLNYDPNYHKVFDNEYKSDLRTLVKDNKIKYVIDIHGLSDLHQYDLGIFFKRKFRKSSELGYVIAAGIGFGKLKDVLINVFNFAENDQETVCEFVCDSLKIPAIQIEIARYIREDDVLKAQLISNLASVLEKLPF